MLGAGCPGCGADGAYFVEKAHFCMSFMLWLHEHSDAVTSNDLGAEKGVSDWWLEPSRASWSPTCF